MISIEVALIITGGMIASPLLMLLLNSHNWFKKESYKFKQQMDRKEANIRFKRLEREFKIKESPPIPPREKGILETALETNPDMVKDLISTFGKKEEEEFIDVDYPEEKPDLLETILDVAEKNPELAKAVTGKLLGAKDGAQEEVASQV
jgi:hypothetical protein